MEFGMYMNNMIDERTAHPQEDIISALAQAEEGGDTLNRMELLSMLFLLLVAGHETTVNLIGNGTLALLQHPDQLDLLRNDPSLIKSAVEEMLRFNGPVDMTTNRWSFEDVDMGDPRDFTNFVTGRQMRFGTMAFFSSLLVIGIVALIYILL